MRKVWASAALVVALTLVAAGCGGGDEPSGTAATEAPTTTAAQQEGGTTVAVASSPLGDILADAEGRTLYAFLPDDQGASTCYDDCAATWPALVVDRGDPTAGDGVDAELLGTTERDDGKLQVTYGDWPLYYFADDETADDVNGQGVGDVWYVVSPDGSPLQDAGTAKGGGYGMG